MKRLVKRKLPLFFGGRGGGGGYRRRIGQTLSERQGLLSPKSSEYSSCRRRQCGSIRAIWTYETDYCYAGVPRAL